MGKPRLLIIDDNKAFTESVAFALNDFQVVQHNAPEDVNGLRAIMPDLILLDLVFDDRFPEIQQGLEMIPKLNERCPDVPVVVLTNYPSIETTVKAIKAGATDFLNKGDLNWNEWRIRLMNYALNAIRIRTLQQRNAELEQCHDGVDLMGVSPETEFLRRRLQDLAQHSNDAVVFLTGETGTGKNHAARYFRKHSPRATASYQEFSILELTESLIESELFGHVKGAFTGATQMKRGLFEEADGGILFLDEIGDYDLKIQSKILRFIDEKVITPVGSGKSRQLNLQLILASNQDIPSLIREKRFREDLYQRINRIRVEILPLRERREDIPLLADHFFVHFRTREKTRLVSMAPAVYEIFLNYPWPGNIRELQSAIWDACTTARLYGDTMLLPKHLKRELMDSEPISVAVNGGENLQAFSSHGTKIARIELDSIEAALRKANGRKSDAAAILGINVDQLRYKISKFKKCFPDIIRSYQAICKAYKPV